MLERFFLVHDALYIRLTQRAEAGYLQEILVYKLIQSSHSVLAPMIYKDV